MFHVLFGLSPSFSFIRCPAQLTYNTSYSYQTKENVKYRNKGVPPSWGALNTTWPLRTKEERALKTSTIYACWKIARSTQINTTSSRHIAWQILLQILLYVMKLYLSIFLRSLEDTRSKSFFIKIKTRCETYFASQFDTKKINKLHCFHFRFRSIKFVLYQYVLIILV